MNGAGEGNRTLISGLGSPHSTTEPHPPAPRHASGLRRTGPPTVQINLFKLGQRGLPTSNLVCFYQTSRRLATGLRERWWRNLRFRSAEHCSASWKHCFTRSNAPRSGGPSWLGCELLDGFAQTIFNQHPPFRRNDLASVQFPHVKTVNGRAAFGHDARGGNVQRQPGQRLRNGI